MEARALTVLDLCTGVAIMFGICSFFFLPWPFFFSRTGAETGAGAEGLPEIEKTLAGNSC